MKEKRSLSVDLVRAFALLYVVVYHIYVISGMSFKYSVINTLISAGGDIGVSIFFVLSGYGIYRKLNNSKNFTYIDFIKDRLKKIAPHYYISLFVCLIFTSSIVFFNKEHLNIVISHFFFFHNFFYSSHGMISGVLWTMGVIVQFYLLAPLLKKAIDKHPAISYFSITALCILIKWLIYFIILPSNDLDNMYYFIYGRQIFNTLDAFVLGMIVAKYERKNKIGKFNYLGAFIIFFIMLVLTLINYNFFKDISINIYSKSIEGLLFFIILDILIALFLFFVSTLNVKYNIISKSLLFISKHEYAIYVWHLLIINSLYSIPTFFTSFSVNSYILCYISVLIFVLVISLIIDLVICNIDFDSIYKCVREWINTYGQYIYILIVLILFIHSFKLLHMSFNNVENYNEKLNECNSSCQIGRSVKEKLRDNEPYSYIYIDTEDTGYGIYYPLKYYLYPNVTTSFNSYFYIINYDTDDNYLQFFKNLDVDYVIVRNSERLLLNNYDLDLNNGKVFIINKEAQDLKNLFLEVK